MKINCLLLVLLLMPFLSSSQISGFQNLSTINPAFTGNTVSPRIYTKIFSSIQPGGLESYSLYSDFMAKIGSKGPAGKQFIGIGMYLNQEQFYNRAQCYNIFTASIKTSWTKPLSLDNHFIRAGFDFSYKNNSLGTEAFVFEDQLDPYSSTIKPHSDDPLEGVGKQGNFTDISVGIGYYNKLFLVGISCLHAFQKTNDLSTVAKGYNLPREWGVQFHYVLIKRDNTTKLDMKDFDEEKNFQHHFLVNSNYIEDYQRIESDFQYYLKFAQYPIFISPVSIKYINQNPFQSLAFAPGVQIRLKIKNIKYYFNIRYWFPYTINEFGTFKDFQRIELNLNIQLRNKELHKKVRNYLPYPYLN